MRGELGCLFLQPGAKLIEFLVALWAAFGHVLVAAATKAQQCQQAAGLHIVGHQMPGRHANAQACHRRLAVKVLKQDMSSVPLSVSRTACIASTANRLR